MVPLLDGKAHIRVFHGELLNGPVKRLAAVTAQTAHPEGGALAVGNPDSLPAYPLIIGHQDQTFLTELRSRRVEGEFAVFRSSKRNSSSRSRAWTCRGMADWAIWHSAAALEKLLFRTTA